jgi:hypothetical protein
MRVMTPATWPRIDLRYQLKDAAGQDLRSRRCRAQGHGLPGWHHHPDRQHPLRYEQKMLRDWFSRTFVHPQP